MEGRASSRLKLFSSCIRSLGRSAAMGNTETSRGWLSPFLLPLFLPPSLYLCVKSRGLWLMYVQVVYFWLAMKYEMTSRALKKWLAEWEISAGPPYVLFMFELLVPTSVVLVTATTTEKRPKTCCGPLFFCCDFLSHRSLAVPEALGESPAQLICTRRVSIST